jgi:hypothetical protein
VKKAFEYWENTGNDWLFSVKSTIYSKLTNWDLKKTEKPKIIPFEEKPVALDPNRAIRLLELLRKFKE